MRWQQVWFGLVCIQFVTANNQGGLDGDAHEDRSSLRRGRTGASPLQRSSEETDHSADPSITKRLNSDPGKVPELLSSRSLANVYGGSAAASQTHNIFLRNDKSTSPPENIFAAITTKERRRRRKERLRRKKIRERRKRRRRRRRRQRRSPPSGSAGLLSLEASNFSIDRGAAQASAKAIRTDGSVGRVSVDFATQPDTATPGDDYTPLRDTLVFEDGETVKTIIIPLTSGTESQPTQQFKITIDNPVGAFLAVPRTATVTLFGDRTVLPNYADFFTLEGLTLNGDAEQEGNTLQLTANAEYLKGSAFYNKKISLDSDGSFRCVFSFVILGGDAGADGLTFAIHNDDRGPVVVGDDGAGAGFNGIGKAVGVEFDTFGNVAGELAGNHVSIVEGTVDNERVQVPAGMTLNDGATKYAWIDYNGASDSLSVYLSSASSKPQYLLAETSMDLEALVGGEAYVGFTAATGGATNAHRILSWQLDQIPPQEDPPTRPGSSIVPVPVVTGVDRPTAVDWLPDGTMLIALKRGEIRVARGGTVNPKPFIDISDVVNNIQDRGLIDIAVHPNFSSNPYVYLAFTYEGDDAANIKEPRGSNAGPDGGGNRAGRLIRVTADAATQYYTAVAGSEVILLGKNSIRAYFNAFADSTDDFDEPEAGKLPSGEYVQDFIHSDSRSHTIGGIAFSPDGSELFVSTGDGASYNEIDIRAQRVQTVDNLSGKILRIDPLTGRGIPNNPFYSITNNPDANSAKVYQIGLRNPFRIAMDKAKNRLYIGEVGWTTWEEVNTGGPGANFGWPFYEGGSDGSVVNSRYAEIPEGRRFFADNVDVVAPVFALNHASSGINAIVLGDMMSSGYYGSKYERSLFFNDLGQGIVRYMKFDAAGKVVDVDVFTTGARLVVSMAQGPDGAMYYCSLNDGIVGRWELQ